jgi:colanic acid biosynthesis glycosyl transferase WcaI
LKKSVSILAIESGFPPELTSARLPFEFARELKNRKYDVTVVVPFPRLNLVVGNCIKSERKFFKREEIAGVPLLRMWPQLKGKSLATRAAENMLLPVTLFVGGLLAGKKSVIHCVSPPFLITFTACVLGKVTRSPVVLRIQDLHPDALVKIGLIKNKALIKFLEGLEIFVYRYADQITVIAEGYRNHVISKGIDSSKVVLIPNWTSNLGVRLSGNNDFRRANGLVGKFIITYAGTMSWPQDLATIVEAANLLRRRDEIVFLLVGDGVQKESLMKRASELHLKNVIFMPLQEREKYFEIINESDLCVVPLKKSYSSPTAPSKMLDIMACTKPMIANVPANSDVSRIVKEAACGLVIEPENPEIFKESALKLYSDNASRKKLANNGKMFVERCLSLKTCMDHYEHLLLNLSKATKS